MPVGEEVVSRTAGYSLVSAVADYRLMEEVLAAVRQAEPEGRRLIRGGNLWHDGLDHVRPQEIARGLELLADAGLLERVYDAGKVGYRLPVSRVFVLAVDICPACDGDGHALACVTCSGQGRVSFDMKSPDERAGIVKAFGELIDSLGPGAANVTSIHRKSAPS